MENPFKKSVEAEDNNVEELKEQDLAQEQSSEEKEESGEEVVAEEEIVEEKNPWQEKYEVLNNQYLRLAADFDNFRKRQEQEKENLLKYGAENTVKKLIEVLDNFERGLKAIETVEDCEKVKECYHLASNPILPKTSLKFL